MESHNLIKTEFYSFTYFWLLYFVHIVLYHFIAADPHMIVFISGGILLLVVTAMYYFRFHPAIIMYSFLYAIMPILRTSHLLNLLLLIIYFCFLELLLALFIIAMSLL
ncbi:hypothetical protein AAAC51_33370 [Priestia megaterium]